MNAAAIPIVIPSMSKQRILLRNGADGGSRKRQITHRPRTNIAHTGTRSRCRSTSRSRRLCVSLFSKDAARSRSVNGRRASGVFVDRSMVQRRQEAFNAIYWSLCGLLFDRVVED
jgi:hypothetical protein